MFYTSLERGASKDSPNIKMILIGCAADEYKAK